MRRITKQQRAQLEPLLRRTGMPDLAEYFQGLTYEDAEWLLVELAYPQFRKVDGTWAVIGTDVQIRRGTIKVHKKDGTAATVKIDRVSKPFDYMGRKMVHGFLKR